MLLRGEGPSSDLPSIRLMGIHSVIIIVGFLIWIAAGALQTEESLDNANSEHLSGKSGISKKRIHANLDIRHDIRKGARSDPATMHEIIFEVQLKNIEALHELVHDISDIKSPNYGKYLTREQLSEMVANPHATDVLTGYLNNFSSIVNIDPVTDDINNIVIVNISRDGRFITSKAPFTICKPHIE